MRCDEKGIEFLYGLLHKYNIMTSVIMNYIVSSMILFISIAANFKDTDTVYSYSYKSFC